MSKQLKDLEDDLFSETDTSKSSSQVTYDKYMAGIEKKMDRSLLTGNMLENKAQAKASSMGGAMLADDQGLKTNTLTIFTDKLKTLILPAFATMMCGTVTYPIAVRIARSRLFKLKGFYAIHLAIAPFLAFVHVNLFGCFFAYGHIKVIERDYDLFMQKQLS